MFSLLAIAAEAIVVFGRSVGKRTLFCLWLVEVVQALCMGVTAPFRKPHRLQTHNVIFEALNRVHLEGTRGASRTEQLLLRYQLHVLAAVQEDRQ